MPSEVDDSHDKKEENITQEGEDLTQPKAIPEYYSQFYEILDLLKDNEKYKSFHKIKLVGVDWSGKDLSNFNLKGANLQGAILERANLKNTNFNSADLRKSYLTFAKMKNTKL